MRDKCNWQEILDTWFEDTRSNPDAIGPRRAWWFGSDADRDQKLRELYKDCCEAALDGHLAEWQIEPSSRLGLILLLDQFPRNLFRGTPRAFSGDDRAAMLCLAGLSAGIDQKLTPIERVFYYMPLQHAEDVVTQRVSVQLFESLATDQGSDPVYSGFAAYARQHLEIIERFGRFPHRNKTLSRPGTQDEIAYLESGGARFGQ